MKRRTLALVVAAFGASTAILVACASEGNGSETPPPDGSAVPEVDAAEASSGDAGDIEIPCSADDCAYFPSVCAPDALCPTGSVDSRIRIQVLRGRSKSDVWAAGGQGTILHFDGNSWTPSSPGTVETLHGLWLRDSSEVGFVTLAKVYTRGLAVGDAGAPSSGGWTSIGAPPGPASYLDALQLESTWAAPGAEWLWCASMYQYDFFNPAGGSGLWRIHVAPGTGELEFADAVPPGMCGTVPCGSMTNVHGWSADDLWAVGFKGAALRVTGAQGESPTVTAFNSQTVNTIHGVWAASPTDAWLVGGAGLVRHYTGHAHLWDVVSDVPTTATLRSIWGSSSSDIWAVGDEATVLHFDGEIWTRFKVAGLGQRRPDLHAVWTDGPGRVWAGGDGILLALGGQP